MSKEGRDAPLEERREVGAVVVELEERSGLGNVAFGNLPAVV